MVQGYDGCETEAAFLRMFERDKRELRDVGVPLEQQMWGDMFGQLTDRFGVSWMVNIAGAGQA